MGKHAFNAAVDETLSRCLGISNQRGGEYQDTWALENVHTPFLDHVLRKVLRHEPGFYPSAQERRLMMVASLCDVKISRLLGPWKQDTADDLCNYVGAFAQWMEEYVNG